MGWDLSRRTRRYRADVPAEVAQQERARLAIVRMTDRYKERQLLGLPMIGYYALAVAIVTLGGTMLVRKLVGVL